VVTTRTTRTDAFASLWSLGLAVHHLEHEPLRAWPHAALALLVILLPAPLKRWAFASHLTFAIIAIALALPAPANHHVLALVASLGLLPIVLTRPSDWVEPLAAPLRASLMVVYFFAVFHKLNADFFDPAVSCATHLYGKVTQLWSTALPHKSAVATPAIYGTLLAEGGIFALLAAPKLRLWGIRLAVVFHLTIAMAVFYDFATFVFALLFAFVAPARPMNALVMAAGLVGMTVASFAGATQPVKYAFWLIAVAPALNALLRRSEPTTPVRTPWLAWAVPAALVLNGLTAYLGLKTVANFSMFSNLRTEGGVSNHLLVPAGALELFPYQRDLVEVSYVLFPESLSLADQLDARRETRWLGKQVRSLVPLMELRRAVAAWQARGIHPLVVAYGPAGGELRRVEDAAKDPELSAAPERWQRIFLAFRDVDRTRCLW